MYECVFRFLVQLKYVFVKIYIVLNVFVVEGGCLDIIFIEDVVYVFLKIRRIFKCFYLYGFFLEFKSIKKEIFELM